MKPVEVGFPSLRDRARSNVGLTVLVYLLKCWVVAHGEVFYYVPFMKY